MAQRSRAERLEKVRGRRKRTYLTIGIAAAALVAIVAIAAGAVLAGRTVADADADAGALVAADHLESAEDTLSAVPATSSPVPVEVPVLTGMTIDEAAVLIDAAGLVLVRVGTPPGSRAVGSVIAQSVAPGTRVPTGSEIELTYADPAATLSDGGLVVCIDPGHQAQANSGQEPVGPNAAETKAKVSGGATGVVTRTPENEVVLEIALKVKERLERYGVQVVMTRTTGAVDISNAQRAQVANDSAADLFLRIHADSSTNADLNGISTLYPAGNDWVAPIEAESLKAAGIVHREVLASTGAKDNALSPRADLAGFNYSSVPSVLVECGFMSNPVEDRKLSEAAYQDRLADGITRGVLEYLGVGE